MEGETFFFLRRIISKFVFWLLCFLNNVIWDVKERDVEDRDFERYNRNGQIWEHFV